MFDSYAVKKQSHGLFYSVFQRRSKKTVKPDLDSPDIILQGSSVYHDLPSNLETQAMIFQLLLLFLCIASNFTGKKKHETGHSNQRSSGVSLNICI